MAGIVRSEFEILPSDDGPPEQIVPMYKLNGHITGLAVA
jgi:hypothetical protein